MFCRIKNDTHCAVFICLKKAKSKAKQIFVSYQSDFHFQVSLTQINQFDLVFPQTCHWCRRLVCYFSELFTCFCAILQAWRRTGLQISFVETAQGRVSMLTYFLPVFDYGIFPLTGLIRDRDSWLMWLRFTSSDWQWTGWSTNLSSGIWMIWSASFFTMFVKGITKLHKHDSRSGYGVIWVWFQNTFRTTRDQKQLFMP